MLKSNQLEWKSSVGFYIAKCTYQLFSKSLIRFKNEKLQSQIFKVKYNLCM